MFNLIIYAIVGGVIGVLINYLSDVLPLTRRFSRPVCAHCQEPHTLRSYLISFKCPKCEKAPPARNFIVLILSILISILVGIFPLIRLSFWLTIPIMVFLGVILVIDIEHHAVLIETSIAGLILFFAYGWYMQGWLLTLIGGGAGFVIMLVIYFLGILFSKGIGKIRKGDTPEEGLGFGDVYAGAFLGLFTGWPYAIGMIIIAILASGLFSFIYLIVKSIKKDYQVASTIPYTPFLILGAIAVNYIPTLPV